MPTSLMEEMIYKVPNIPHAFLIVMFLELYFLIYSILYVKWIRVLPKRFGVNLN
jgi:hypothetical protein